MLTRRRFVQTVGFGAAAYVAARGRENSIWSGVDTPLLALEPGTICLASNENPLGPGREVLAAVTEAFGPTGGTPGPAQHPAGRFASHSIARTGVAHDEPFTQSAPHHP